MSLLNIHKKSINTISGLLLFLVATSLTLYAQDPTQMDDIDKMLDNIFFDDKRLVDDILESTKTYSIFYTNYTFNNNTFFSGRYTGYDQYNILPQLSYYDKSGFNMSLSGILYEKFDPKWDFTGLSVGYHSTLGQKKIIDYNVGYTKYFFTDNSTTFTNAAEINLGIKNIKKSFGASVSTTYLFGDDVALMFTPIVYSKITIKEGKHISIKLVPQINFNIANQYMTFIDPSLSNETDIQYVSYKVFDLLNTQLNFPIKLLTKNFDLEAGYSLNFPNPVAIESNLGTTGFFNFSFGYLINLN